MEFNGQDAGAFGLVAIAAGYLLRRVWGIVANKKAGGSDGCSSCDCAGNSMVKLRPFVSVKEVSQPIDDRQAK